MKKTLRCKIVKLRANVRKGQSGTEKDPLTDISVFVKGTDDDAAFQGEIILKGVPVSETEFFRPDQKVTLDLTLEDIAKAPAPKPPKKDGNGKNKADADPGPRQVGNINLTTGLEEKEEVKSEK